MTTYTCACGWAGSSDEMAPIKDIEERVLAGELMAAGACPRCGDLCGVADEDVPDYTLQAVATIMRQRGWGVTAPDSIRDSERDGSTSARHFAVFGRMVGQEQDLCHCVQADNEEAAERAFVQWVSGRYSFWVQHDEVKITRIVRSAAPIDVLGAG